MRGRIIACLLTAAAISATALSQPHAQEVTGQAQITVSGQMTDDQGTKTFHKTIVVPAGEGGVLSIAGDALPEIVADLPPHWIGVVCFPVNDAMRAQLDVPKGAGLLVASVMSKSPAAEAGIQTHDILLKAGDKPLAKVTDLLDAVRDAKEKQPLAVELLRKGKKETVKVQPAQRPAEAEVDLPKVMIDIMGEGAHPGGHAAQPFPKDLEVTITKKGPEPAKIVVRRGDEKWEATEATLDKLPKDVRQHVATWLMVGNAQWAASMFDLEHPMRIFHSAVPGAAMGIAPKAHVRVFGLSPKDLEKKLLEAQDEDEDEDEAEEVPERLKAVERQLKQLQGTLDALKKKTESK
jgi:membrane-associated protease RseP (regulator of RpoE activity)